MPPLPGVPQIPLSESFARLNEYPEGSYRELRAAVGRETGLPVSIGVATLEDAEMAARDLMVMADRALYQAKRAGRNGFAVLHGPGMDSRR